MNRICLADRDLIDFAVQQALSMVYNFQGSVQLLLATGENEPPVELILNWVPMLAMYCSSPVI